MIRNLTVFIHKVCSDVFVYKVCDVYGKILAQGISKSFDFKYNIFNSEKHEVHDVNEIVFDF